MVESIDLGLKEDLYDFSVKLSLVVDPACPTTSYLGRCFNFYINKSRDFYGQLLNNQFRL
jgi:hypothetical protein